MNNIKLGELVLMWFNGVFNYALFNSCGYIQVFKQKLHFIKFISLPVTQNSEKEEFPLFLFLFIKYIIVSPIDYTYSITQTLKM